jgi:hypothetical protein
VRFCGRFRTKLARLVMKFFLAKHVSLMQNCVRKFANVNAPFIMKTLNLTIKVPKFPTISIEQCVLDTNAENNCLKLPQISK